MNASGLIDKQIADLADWRGDLCARLRNLIDQADPGIVEEWEWNTALKDLIRAAVTANVSARYAPAYLEAQ